MTEKFQSNAQWPLDVYRGMRGDGISTDVHETRDGAQAVCDALRREGFGGQREHFPLLVWVSEVQS